jgi:mRNA interferase RelE/StbE
VETRREFKIKWVPRWNIHEHLERIWDPEYQPPRIDPTPPSPRRARDDSVSGVALSMPAQWYVGLTSTFEKSIKGVDKKLQGRILEAVVALCAGPTTAQGDTIQPLEGNLVGLWRYRIGDYRLIYYPDINERRIVLLTFSPRGDVY